MANEIAEPDLGALTLAGTLAALRNYKEYADRAIAQTSDRDLHAPLDQETNSIAIIMKHMAGNMISRWTDFLTSDGEKPSRHRDEEFVDRFTSRKDVLEYWERGWSVLFKTIESLSPDDLGKSVHIRGEVHSAIGAIQRQLAHYGYHVGQIVLIARHYAKDQWKTLTIPRGGSEAYNRRMGFGPRS